MKARLVSLFPATLACASFASAANAADPYGNWTRPSTGTQVNF